MWLIYLVVAYVYGGIESAGKIGIPLICPLFCIWFAEAMGNYIGPTTSASITERSPAWAVCLFGWVLLLLPAIAVIIGIVSLK
ncbi:MAG TPA: hypothetical protein VHG71_13565 [Verrucomicrobiae bacterium]|nr:hypothetical protein [Verrucomicrobiae bacterium]